ncbi:MAG: hypothetical protein PWP14_2250 [Methanolobus sp.]|nr:hypothetical protein [Methanolobus sp.]
MSGLKLLGEKACYLRNKFEWYSYRTELAYSACNYHVYLRTVE